MSGDTSTTFGSWSDRLTYLLAEGQLLVVGILLSLGAALVIFRPEIPGVPPIFVGWFAVLILFGPPLFGFFVVLITALRERAMVAVHHVDAESDTIQKYYVPPSIWKEKKIDGPAPYPVNGGRGWAVKEFEWLEEIEQLTVKGVWLEECQDTKLLTKKSHMEAIYGKLTESHIRLNILRDSVNELGGDIQKRIINSTAEARERGTMLDKTAVKDVFEEFGDRISDTDEGDLPNMGVVDEVADDAMPDPPTATANAGGQQEAPADD